MKNREKSKSKRKAMVPSNFTMPFTFLGKKQVGHARRSKNRKKYILTGQEFIFFILPPFQQKKY